MLSALLNKTFPSFLQEVISKLEDLVFSPDGFPKELQDGVSYHSTVLALGSVVGKLQANGMQERALGLVNKLHSWLGIHGTFDGNERE